MTSQLDYSNAVGARCPANIALVKYWGKRDPTINLPLNGSLSLTLGDNLSTTTFFVPFKRESTESGLHFIFLDSNHHPTHYPPGHLPERVAAAVDELGLDLHGVIISQNTVPTAAGLASSASAGAALVLALASASPSCLLPRKLSVAARRASGSACRSLYGGWVLWHAGTNSQDSVSEPLYDGFSDVLADVYVVSDAPKAVGSREGMAACAGVPGLLERRASTARHHLSLAVRALKQGDWAGLVGVANDDSDSMHKCCEEAGIVYITPAGAAVAAAARAAGAVATFDAGPNPVVLSRDVRVLDELRTRFPDLRVIRSVPSEPEVDLREMPETFREVLENTF